MNKARQLLRYGSSLAKSLVEPGAEVVGVVGLKDGVLLREVSGPNVEPWFVVNTQHNHSHLTKDAEFYHELFALWSTSALDKALPLRWDSCIFGGGPDEFLLGEQVLVKEAIERYVMEVGQTVSNMES